MLYCHPEEPISPSNFHFTLDEYGDLVRETHTLRPKIAEYSVNRYTFFLPKDEVEMITATNQLLPEIAQQYSGSPPYWLATWSIHKKKAAETRSIPSYRYAEPETFYPESSWQIERNGELSAAIKPSAPGDFGFDRDELKRHDWHRLLYLPGLPSEENILSNPAMQPVLQRFVDSRTFAPTPSLLNWLEENDCSVLYPFTNVAGRTVLVYLTPKPLKLDRLQSADVPISIISDIAAKIFWSSSY